MATVYDDDELTPTERALKVGYMVARQGEITTEEVARLTGLSLRGARDMLARAGRVLPICYDGSTRMWKLFYMMELD